MKKIFVWILLALWAALAVFAWLIPSNALSESERRPLAQMPELSAESLSSGSFMEAFEAYSLDQFPLREGFRKVKALFHSSVLRQKDSNGIYLADGYAVMQEYPLNEASVDHAISRFSYLYEKYLTDSRVFMAIVPDKGYYLAESAGQLRMDYDRLFTRFREEMPWASQIDLTGVLSAEDYYRTDTHWRQEKLLEAAALICERMAAAVPEASDFTLTELERPFYGVYYGQAALPMEPDTMYLLESPWLEACTVYDYETGKTASVYDMTRLESKDLYDVYLSGSKSLLAIENPASGTDRELIVFRDSFGSAMIPLLIRDYARVTVVDIRYIQIDVLERFVEFGDQDVLLLYSTLVLNNSETIK